MHAYNLRQRVNRPVSNANSNVVSRRVSPPALVSFKKPPKESLDAADGDQQFLQTIYASRPYHVNNQWCLEASWHGIKGVFDEPITMLIRAGGYPVIYYLNDIHQQYSSFSEHWMSICNRPSIQIATGCVILVHLSTPSKF